ncbi:glucose 1-dehydrogenase [Lacihabitans sp. CCS-44]|uniref:glucose 1-dehydrogenase n=1 Tax=Lacihabitans sp. CCS-44 TaxID=2487331 RepID=UPI0020CF10C7|nr:glucose 1-dehydrogenase [Lacihabitans sp. CCS-44]MCP9754271.1 glucose 1-dehydrogenase [Lacihabitans sp. CCS-44]
MKKDMFSLDGKVAIVTGASKGIGEAIARVFAQYGAKVVISSRKQTDLEVLAEDIKNDYSAEVLPLAAHAGDINQLQELLSKTIEVFGQVDILVNNAATNPVFGPSLDCSGDAFDKIMQVNVKSPFEFAKLVYPFMKQNGGGSIVNISSIAGTTPDPGLGMYSVSKAALNMLTKVLAKEWGMDGIRVNALSPGLIKTKFSQALWENPKMLEHFTKRLPIARMGSVDEIAALVLYLASNASAYTTGVNFQVDGGTTI